MAKNKKGLIIFTSLATLIPLVVGLIMWNELPQQIATHFNAEGQADGFSPKEYAVFGLPAFILVIHIICAFATSMDPKSKNINDKIYAIMLWVCPVISVFCSVLIYGPYMGLQVDVLMVCNMLMAVMLLVIGNYMPKSRQNYTIGIKLGWTLEDEDNWNKTHRFAGWLWMLGGIVLLINSYFKNVIVLLVVLALISILPVVFSGIYHANKRKKQGKNGSN